LRPFLEEHLELLRADVCVISDSSMARIDAPAITHSLRGMTYMEVEVRGPREDLHSGFWGGATHNPALALVEILGKLYNEDGTIAVPGFYDDVVALTDDERAMIAKNPLSEEQFKAATGVPALWGDEQFTVRERVSARPTLDINGMWSGYSGPGPKTIIPAVAGAKLSSRLVGNQNPHKIFDLIKTYIASITPPTVQVDVQLLTTGEPALIGTQRSAEMQGRCPGLRTGLGATPIFTRVAAAFRGGGPVQPDADLVVMMGFWLDDDGLQCPTRATASRCSSEALRRPLSTWTNWRSCCGKADFPEVAGRCRECDDSSDHREVIQFC
ncbi:MAG: peptidase dimerization domain-containing protein, partial [Caldilineaceae bacterium]